MAAAVSLQPRLGRYAWDLNGYLRAGGKLAQVLEAFQDEYAVPTMRDRQPRIEKKAAPVHAAPVQSGMGATFCKGR
jgi:hypothetical protein